MDRPAHPDPAAVVDRHPRRSRRRVDQGVQQRPVGDGVGAVGHALRLPVRRGDRPAVQVVPPDHDRGGQLAARDHLVEPLPREVPLAVAEPADARGQSLERHALPREADPAGQSLVVAEEVQHRAVGGGDVRRLTRQRGPAERALALAEQRPDVGGHEPGIVERALVAAEFRLTAQRVAVVEHLRARVEEPDHRLDVLGHRLAGAVGELVGFGLGVVVPVVDGDALRQVGERVVGGGLVGDDVDLHTTPQQLRQHLGGVTDHGNRQRRALALRPLNRPDRTVQISRDLVQVPCLDPAAGALGVALDHERHAVVHGDRQGLGAAHPAEARGDGERAP